MKKPLVCVTGASGGLGQALLEELVGRYTVRALFRRATGVGRHWADRGCQIILGDLRDGHALNELVRETELVFHCAAEVMGFSPTAFFEVNVRGTQNLVETVAAHKCRRFVHVSSIAVYSGTEVPESAAFTEDLALTEHASMDPYSLSKLQGEKVVIAALKNTATEYTILRPTCIYGPQVQSWTLIPLKLLLKNRTLFLGLDHGNGLMDAVYVGDVVDALLAAGETAQAPGEIFNIGHETVTFRDFYSYLGQMVGRQPRFGSERTLRRLAKIMHAGSRLTARFLPDLEKGVRTILWMSLNRHRYPSAKANAMLGYTPRFALPAGMLNTELWLREQHQIPRTHHRIPNADRHYFVRPTALVRPETESDIVQTIREAAQRSLKVKALGALHSFAPIPDTDGIGIALDRYQRVLSVDGTSVTVEAGITISELNRELAAYQRALPIHGSHTAQTVAGAISTATHGGSLHHGTLSDHVEAIRLVKSNAEVIAIRPADPCFSGAAVSLGLLGVISTVTLRCVPQFSLRSDVAVKPLDEVLEEFDAIQRDNEYVDLRYHPQTNQVEMLLINRTSQPPTAFGASGAAVPRTPRRQKRLVSLTLKTLLNVLAATRSESLHRAVLKRLVGKFYQARVGSSDHVLTFTDLGAGEPFPIDDLEFALPYSMATSALRDLSDHFRRTRQFPRFFPVHIRCSKAGEHWLSPNYRQDVCWFEFWHYPPNPQLYAALDGILQRYNYRMHWGKLCAAEPARLRRRFPRWQDFARLRREWDPTGMFLNAYLARWFLDGP